MPGLYTHVTRASGTILTATIYNSDHQNHIDNHIPAMIDDYSLNIAQMQVQIDPGELGTESLATDLAGEIARFRWALKELKGTTYWYESAVNLALTSSANVFTANQSITKTAGTVDLTLTTTDAGASGARLIGRHISPSPAVNDIVLSIISNANDSALVETGFGQVRCVIVDATDGSEDGKWEFVTVAAGASLVRATVQNGMFMAGATGSDKGIGTINAVGLYVNGHGTVAQHVPAFNNNYVALGVILPQDDTIPQITEGDEVLSVNITPTHAGSRIYIKAVLNVGGAAGLVVTASIFRVGFSNASNSSSVLINAATTMEQVVVEASYQTGAVTPETFTIRCGSATATDAKLNGDNTTRQFGGTSVTRVDVFEILPQ